jgi:phage FluMu protein Com
MHPTNNPQAARRDTPVRCAVCGRVVARASRQQRFCSARCRKRHAYAENARTDVFVSALGQHSGSGTNPPKKSNGFNGVQAAKSGSNPPIYAPPWVIERELFAGRDWHEAVSPDGVVTKIARLAS